SPWDIFITAKGKTEIERNENYPYWQRIAISFNIRALKIYFGEQRIANIPNLWANPTGFSIGSKQCHAGQFACIRNIRIAKGNMDLYERVVTDGKFITNGIRFDVGKATIKPESMGIINQIVKLMVEHNDLNFSVEGHTDSDGDDSFNQKLSEERAAAVKQLLVEMGIDNGRLETKGFGESKPVDSNATPEGKANNRRVEFIKI
ncbi:MAG TPA: OmpA family protein, partial [Draconibacterium sp.]|nr:OmpA family protein [Draconibacterium sp.]